MPRHLNSVPTYRKHTQSGQAVTTVRNTAGRRREVYLGPYDSPESRAEYERVLAPLRVGRTPWADAEPAAGLTVAEVLVRYWRHAQTYYANPKVRDNVRLAIKPARLLYGPLPAAVWLQIHWEPRPETGPRADRRL